MATHTTRCSHQSDAHITTSDPSTRDAQNAASELSPDATPGAQNGLHAANGADKSTTQVTDHNGAKQARLLRHRESCRKSYQKKTSTLTALRDELTVVERTYDALLPSQLTSPLLREGEDPTTASRRRAYLDLARRKRDLVVENEVLYRRNAASMTLDGRLQQVLDIDAPPIVGKLPFPFVPLLHATSARILADARHDVLRFAHSPHKLSLRASVFGWTDYRQVVGNELKYALEKHFPALSARELVDRTWRVVSSEQRCVQLYNPSLQIALQILQRIDDDTLLVYRTIRADALAVLAKTVFLLSRMEIPEGYLVLFRSIDPQLVGFLDDAHVDRVLREARAFSGRQQQQQQQQQYARNDERATHHDVWIEKYSWVLLYEDGPHGCRFQFGGSTMSNVWLKEVLFIALRWESMVVGPAFQLDL